MHLNGNLDIVKLEPNNKEAIEYLSEFFSDPDICCGLPDDQRGGYHTYVTIARFNAGLTFCYVPTISYKPIGLFWAEVLKPGIVEVHQGIYQEFRNYSTLAAKKFMIELEKIEQLEVVMGLAPCCIKGGVMTAVKAGMTRRGKIYRYYTINGKKEDVWIMIREVNQDAAPTESTAASAAGLVLSANVAD